MNKTKIFITTMLVAALAAGCSKEEINNGSASSGTRNNVMRIFAGSFQNDSKVTYDPTNVNDVNWVLGEQISLGCSDEQAIYPISQYNGNPNMYCLDFESGYPFENDGWLTAIYPASDAENDVDVTNTNTTRGIVLNNLVIKGTGDNSKMAFPMAASGNYEYLDDDTELPELWFKHLTAGFRVRLSGNALTPALKSLRIVALSGNADAANFQFTVDVNGVDVTASWGKTGNGPVLPAGPVGSNDQDVVVSNYSEMNFTVDETAIAGDSEDGYSMDFCIPVTIQSFRSLVIVGYAENGTVLFKKTTNFATERTIVCNHMYTLPEINL